jgi:hypothetical protein
MPRSACNSDKEEREGAVGKVITSGIKRSRQTHFDEHKPDQTNFQRDKMRLAPYLSNGDKVTGSEGISAEIRKKCFK